MMVLDSNLAEPSRKVEAFAVDFFDVIVVGASFSAAAFVHGLGQRGLKVLVLDRKAQAGSSVETTGLITEETRQIFTQICDIDRYITNQITTIAVVDTDFQRHFFSSHDQAWIFQTDTKALAKAMIETMPAGTTVWSAAEYAGLVAGQAGTHRVIKNGQEQLVQCRLVVGADGSVSRVAQAHNLDQNRQFLFGIEALYRGKVLLGPHAEKTIFHIWFGEFSLGYGGWLSATVADGQGAFRIGLAKKLGENRDAARLLKEFTAILEERGLIAIDPEQTEALQFYGGRIPIGGTLPRICGPGVVLVGDAAGFCGAFAADGIKGALVSGQEAALLAVEYLEGKADWQIFKTLHRRMDQRKGLIRYYRKQVFYRFVWDLMQTNRSFQALFRIVEREKAHFVQSFCQSKDQGKSLLSIVLKAHNIPALFGFAFSLLGDILGRMPRAKRSRRQAVTNSES